MKKSKNTILLSLSVSSLFIIFAVLFFMNSFSLASEVSNSCDANSCRLSPSNSMVIDMHGTAKLIENSLVKEIFIPVSSATEWAQFRTYYPVGITMIDPICDLPWGGTINHGESVTAYASVNSYGCCLEPIIRTCDGGILSGDSNYSQSSCSGNTITYNYNGSSWSAKCIEKNGLNWFDRNLGSSQVCTALNDSSCYGDLFQWGRDDDGHQVRTSSIVSTLSSMDDPGHGNFISVPFVSPIDWRSPQNNSLWQGEVSTNNPCPSGWRVPTENELNDERKSWSSNDLAGAYLSSLKWSEARYRDIDGSMDVDNGAVWSSSYGTASGSYGRYLSFNSFGRWYV